MAVKIRLQRHGKKGKPFYWIVAADARSKRDGKYLEKIGTYDPNQKPASIDLDFDSALSWLAKGAQPTSTAKAILSYSGVLLKRHLDGGVKKGAFTEEEAKKRFDKWMKEKSAKVEKKIEDVKTALESNKKEARDREEEYRKKKLEDAKAAAEAKAAEEAPAEEAPAEELLLKKLLLKRLLLMRLLLMRLLLMRLLLMRLLLKRLLLKRLLLMRLLLKRLLLMRLLLKRINNLQYI
jgi:small subunit ribosomal protein S16